VHFKGWSSRYDETLPSFSARIWFSSRPAPAPSDSLPSSEETGSACGQGTTSDARGAKKGAQEQAAAASVTSASAAAPAPAPSDSLPSSEETGSACGQGTTSDARGAKKRAQERMRKQKQKQKRQKKQKNQEPRPIAVLQYVA
jgi:hypothetical protein